MIDWSQVDDLRSDMGDGFPDLVEVFLQEAADGIARLDGRGAAQALAADLHFLKGAALNLGFRRFAALCSEGEDAANAGAAERVDLVTIRAAYEQSRREFLSGLSRRAA